MARDLLSVYSTHEDPLEPGKRHDVPVYKMPENMGRRSTGAGRLLARALCVVPQGCSHSNLPEAAGPWRQLWLFRKVIRILWPAYVQVSPRVPGSIAAH